ncbi:hypothetical protein QFC21_003750 [Naganishia friedmannii]|uniref:Uncharacterized protein n=1 Tax=Naganishia friedmannii TaxID=89922 RepID=A0ACC2VMI5_9TREE|nr:hypothetical protein QFC21_003750 [Naganishia friedmannii]
MKLKSIAWALLIPISQASQTPLLLADDSTKDLEPVRQQHVEPAIHTEAITTIDILSSSPNHSTFLHLLQRTKLIPTLNLVQGSSIFAPTDEAWSAWGEAQDASIQLVLSRDTSLDVADNVLFGLRQHILYHVLNYTLHGESAADQAATVPHITTETTLLYPGRSIMAPSPDRPPTGPPWMPQGGDGDLGGDGQQLRICYADGQPIAVGCNADGEGGTVLWDGWPSKKKNLTIEEVVQGNDKNRSAKPDEVVRHASNGVVIGIQQVLQPPPTIAGVITSEPRLSYLSRLLGDELSTTSSTADTGLPSLSDSRHLTFFAPSDDAFFSRFDHSELKYLESDWGLEGIRRVLGHHLISTAEAGKTRDVHALKGTVGWRSSFEAKHGKSHKTRGEYFCNWCWLLFHKLITAFSCDLLVLDIDYNPLEVQVKSGGMTVNETSPVAKADIFASNGVIHIVDRLLLPTEFTLLNSPEKLLLSLNATRFVSLLRMANLSETYTAKHPDQPYTFLAPTDDVLERMDRWGKGWWLRKWESLADVKSDGVRELAVDEQLVDVLRYHILPGKLSLKDLKDGLLLETELQTERLGGERQRIKVDVGARKEKDGEVLGIGDIKIGDGTLTAQPVEIGDSIIYLISTLLEPPGDLVQTAVSDLSLSTFVASLFAAGLDRFVKRSPSKTYFAPQNKAFEELGLVMKYLLLPDAKPDLKKLIRYHAVDQMVYLDEIVEGQQSLNTVAGEPMLLNRTMYNESNPTNITNSITVFGPQYQLADTSTMLPANGDPLQGNLIYGNMLTSTGALHVIDRVLVPPNLDITIGKLVAGAKISTMADLLIKAKLEWILTGEQPSGLDLMRLGLTVPISNDNVYQNTPEYSLAPAYTLLCPTDHAFSQINLTEYRSNEVALLSLLKLHLIPSSQIMSAGLTGKGVSPPQNGNPLALDEAIAYPTLRSGESNYGDLIMRNVVGDEWIVGVKNARGQSQDHNAGRLLSWGRATPRWLRDSPFQRTEYLPSVTNDIEAAMVNSTWNGVMTLGGGVLVIDNVLLPFEPSWFFQWGWQVGLLGFAGLLTLGMTMLGLWFVRVRRAREEAKYEALEGEEEE